MVPLKLLLPYSFWSMAYRVKNRSQPAGVKNWALSAALRAERAAQIKTVRRFSTG